MDRREVSYAAHVSFSWLSPPLNWALVMGTKVRPESDRPTVALGHPRCRSRINTAGENGPGRPDSRPQNGESIKGLSARAASRGTLSPRQKQDILFLAELAQSKGLALEMHGVKVGPQVALEPSAPAHKGKSMAATQDGGAAQEAHQMRLLAQTGSSSTTHSSKPSSTSNNI